MPLPPIPVFPNPTLPLEVDIACGKGDFVLAMARQFPDRNFLGSDLQKSCMDELTAAILQEGLQNCLAVQRPAGQLVSDLPDACADKVHFSMPEHIGPQNVFNDDLFAGIRRILKPGGEFLFVTDDYPYVVMVTEVASRLGGVEKQEWTDHDRPKTYWETELARRGRKIYRRKFLKLN